MSVYALIASFGGGVIGAYMGALPVFILIGIVALIGATVAMAGGPDVTINFVAFGSYLGPHIAFAGGVAAAAYAGKIKKLSSGADILSSLNGLNDPKVLCVGGVFGVFGFLVAFLLGDILKLNTDLPGMTVVISAIVARLAFGSSGLIPKAPEGEKKTYLTLGSGLYCNILIGIGVSTAVSFAYMAMLEASVDPTLLAFFPTFCFGLAGTSLIFNQTGFATPATHHIALISSLATLLSGNPLIGVVFGILTAVFADFIAKTFNTNSDTHIDPPAFTIFIFTFIVNTLFGTGFFMK